MWWMLFLAACVHSRIALTLVIFDTLRFSTCRNSVQNNKVFQFCITPFLTEFVSVDGEWFAGFVSVG